MPPSSTPSMGREVHQDTRAVASVATTHDAELVFRGTRPGALEHLIRQLPSQATRLLFGYAAGPWGDWRAR